MAEGKESFILYRKYRPLFERLSREKAGDLIKHIFRYIDDEFDEKTEDPDDEILYLAWILIKQDLKRDLTKYRTICSRNRENGQKGGRPKTKKTQKTQSVISDNLGNPKKPKKPDNDYDSDNDNDNDNEKKKINARERDFIIERLQELNCNFIEVFLSYIDYLRDEHSRDVGMIHVEQTMKKLNTWYDNDHDRSECLSGNMVNGWKTLNMIKPVDIKKRVDISKLKL